jgi:hypothetical protein
MERIQGEGIAQDEAKLLEERVKSINSELASDRARYLK